MNEVVIGWLSYLNPIDFRKYIVMRDESRVLCKTKVYRKSKVFRQVVPRRNRGGERLEDTAMIQVLNQD